MTVACVSDTKTNQYSDKICYYVADVSAIVWQVWEWVRVWVRESVCVCVCCSLLFKVCVYSCKDDFVLMSSRLFGACVCVSLWLCVCVCVFG